MEVHIKGKQMTESFDWSHFERICMKYDIDKQIESKKAKRKSPQARQLLESDTCWHFFGTATGYRGMINERFVNDQLVTRLPGAEAEVECLCGRVDILTENSVIEIKQADQWKCAVGQVLSYNVYFKKPTAFICLFNTCAHTPFYVISQTCKALNVRVLIYLRTGEILEYR
jgi:hypothetical protein